ITDKFASNCPQFTCDCLTNAHMGSPRRYPERAENEGVDEGKANWNRGWPVLMMGGRAWAAPLRAGQCRYSPQTMVPTNETMSDAKNHSLRREQRMGDD